MDKGVRLSSRLSLVLLDLRAYMAAAVAVAAAAAAMVAAAAVATTEVLPTMAVLLLALVAVGLLALARARVVPQALALTLAMVVPLAATGPQLSPGVHAQLATPIHTQTLPTQTLSEATTSFLSAASWLLMVSNEM